MFVTKVGAVDLLSTECLIEYVGSGPLVVKMLLMFKSFFESESKLFLILSTMVN